ncbi:hypothetical protein [Amycolatopsis sp. CA-128772]|uniref:hypothetical protein n=1 Tax=Amycolatopsis sp. CA-128772 TaxID=2073159 RepID=UPI000CD13659|nr:hypothetical protein [Amycolatopsis sp. CA-128772]
MSITTSHDTLPDAVGADEEPWYPPPAATMTVQLAQQMASTAYQQAEQRVARLVRQLLPQAACPDDRMRLLFLYAAEETYLASVFPAVHHTHPERWQSGTTAHRLAAELAGMIATAEEAIATGRPYRPGGFDVETGYIAQAMAHYVTDPAPAGRAGVLDAVAQYLRTHQFPGRAVGLVADVATALRVTAISGNPRVPAPPAAA